MFVLHDVEGYRHDEIAGMTGVTVGDIQGSVAPSASAPQEEACAMTCEEALVWLDDFVDGELGEAEYQEIELHLAACAASGARGGRLRALVERTAKDCRARWRRNGLDLWPGVTKQIQVLQPAAARPRRPAWPWRP